MNHALKGTILQRTYRKMTILWSFSYNSFENFHGKKIWEPDNMTVLYPNWCYNELCLIGPLKVFFYEMLYYIFLLFIAGHLARGHKSM